VSGTYKYYDWILAALADHGLVPRADTPPLALRDAVNDLYRYEIRRLRRSLLAGDFPKAEYAARVVALRKRYLVLSVPLAQWLVTGAPDANKDR
jgi:hypothetical protein